MYLTDTQKEILRYIVQERGGRVEDMKYIADLQESELLMEINSWKIRASERRNVLNAELMILNSLLDAQSGEQQ